MKTLKPELQKIMRTNLICSKQEAQDAIAFIIELLELDIDETKEHAPHATKAIEEMKIAISRVQDLEEFFNGYK